MTGRTYSLSEAAAILGKDRNTLSKWLNQGCPAVAQADRARGIEWSLAIPDIVEWLIDRAVGDAVESTGGSASISRDEADRRKAVAQAVQAEVATAELLDDVINRHDAAADTAAFAVALRTALTNVCGKIAGRAASMTVPAEIEEFVQAEMNRAFAAAQEQLSQGWDDEPEGDGGAGEGSGPPGG